MGTLITESPTDQLRSEHELIMMVVEAMHREVAAADHTRRVHRGRVEQMVDFAREFTDRCHHVKEEQVLFPALEERSASARSPVSVMR